ncbi:MAG: Dabb family protein [Coprobacillus sp.]
MIKHIVCFKLKDNSLENCQKARDVLMSMEGKIELLKDIKVGIDFLHSDRSYDIILETLFNSKEDLEAYQNDPYHCEVVKTHMHKVREASVAIDYYID